MGNPPDLDSRSHTKIAKLNPAERVVARELQEAGKRWVAQPCSFRLKAAGSNSYRPDFYVFDDDVYIEVVGTREQRRRCWIRAAAFRSAYPLIRLEVRECFGWRQRPPTCPGDVLREEFMKQHSMNTSEAARRMRMAPSKLSRILKGSYGVTADTALRFAKLTGTTPEFWLQLQNAVDLYQARQAMKRSA